MGIRVFVVDDHDLVRQGLKAIFNDQQIQLAGEATTADETLSKLKADKVDVVLLDVRLKDSDGLNLLARIKMDFPQLQVLVYSGYDNPTFVARAVALGAAGYLLKETAVTELVAAIQQVAAGESTWTRESLRRVTGALATPRVANPVSVPLTQRENDVLKLIAEGATNKVIAKDLRISYETVKEHVQNILKKIGVSDRTQAAVWAVRNGLV